VAEPESTDPRGAEASTGHRRIQAYATCAGCGCACDDIEVTVADGRLAGLTRTCQLGDLWFAERGGD
jgi:hypothetical protein